jgi:UDP-N-acetylmuramate--alanine ligase
VVNNVEADHLECYGSVENLEAAFVEFAGRARRVLVGANDAGARRIGARLGSKALTFGLDQADLLLSNVEQRPSGSRAGLRFPDGRQVTLRLAVPGVHNLRNATAALGVVWSLDGRLEPALEALASYRGLGRRFERLGEVGGVVLVDDYAHHPSELVATLAAARQAFPDRRLVAVFQPHLFSRTASHGIAMGQALAAADLAVVAEIYAAREQPVAGVTAALVVDAAKLAGGQVVYEPDRSRLTERVRDLIKPGDVVLTLGAGDITKVGRELVEWLRAA